MSDLTAPEAALAAAISAAVNVAHQAGLGIDSSTQECVEFAATLCETTPGAAGAWARAVRRDLANHATCAAIGRQWRQRPTPGLAHLNANRSPHSHTYATALANIASAAATLGNPSIVTIATANTAANAQLSSTIQPATNRPEPAAGNSATDETRSVTQAATRQPSDNNSSLETKPARALEEVLAELDSLVGLDNVKAEVHRQTQVLRVAALRKQADLPNVDINRHMVFVGNPGTGKTTIARLICDIYHSMGLLTGGQLIEVDRSGLVAGYVGQTAIKTREAVDRAIGGMLFIDEAYALEGDQYGTEATDTLVKGMEDERDQLIVGVAGYPDEMFNWIATNPGLESRFRLVLQFDDYTDDELVEIFQRLAKRNKYTIDDTAAATLRDTIGNEPRGQGFGNARYIRNLFENAVVAQAWRLRDVKEPTRDELCAITANDITPRDNTTTTSTPADSNTADVSVTQP